ncbi:Ca2+-binding RTX toxin-like protein [Duganella sp. SG902]|uniref:beta strand repeat-containing protein n=1 Tax=Duganella sp. SG902 TaxID=2587016 RepID=UPI00179F990A|nr:Ca2+-binding RTX toxin-like protein [Duganella sp. SG902]
MGIFQGTTGNDGLVGSGNNDTLKGLAGNDTLDGGSGADLIDGGDGDDVLSDQGGANVFHGGDGNDRLYHSAYEADTMFGDAGDDLFVYSVVSTYEAQATGGSGRDTYRPDSGDSGLPSNLNVLDFTVGPNGDLIDLMPQLSRSTMYADGNPFSAANGYVRVIQDGADTKIQMDRDGTATNGGFSTVLTLKNVDASTLTADNFVGGLKPDGTPVIGLVASATTRELFGTSFNDQLSSGPGAHYLYGYGGDDLLQAGAGDAQGGGDGLYGGSGNDTLNGGAAADVLDGGAGNDSLGGGDGNDRLNGGAGNDTLQGGAGNDTLSASDAGLDSLDGGDGDDTFVYKGSGAPVSIATGGGGRDVYQPSMENYYYGLGTLNMKVTDFMAGAGGDQIDLTQMLSSGTSYQGGNPFSAELGYARLQQVGADTVVQLSANNIASGRVFYYTVLTLANVDKASLTADNFVGGLKPDGSGIVGVSLSTSDTQHTLGGGNFDDTLTAINGANALSGHGGNDVLQGGSGDDQGHGDTLDGGSGNDTLLGGGADDSLRGGAGNDQLAGGVGNDTLDGNAGSDLLQGGGGDDVFYVDANAGADADTLDGGDGDDLFVYNYGVAGAALATGGGGADIYQPVGPGYILNSTSGKKDTLTITDFTAGAGGDQIDLLPALRMMTEYSGGNPFAGDNGHARLTQSGADTLVQLSYAGHGNAAIPFQTVLILKNVLADSLTADNFVHGIAPDGSAVSTAPQYADQAGVTMEGGYFNDTLVALSGTNQLSGGGGDDLLQGGAGDAGGGDTLDGGWGNDTLIGGAGNDVLAGGPGRNLLQGGAGNDTLWSGNGTSGETLQGGAGDDYFELSWHSDGNVSRAQGDDGNDSFHILIDGNTGADVLSGGAGRDTYTFATGPYWYSGSTYIEIGDFRAGDGGDVLNVIELMAAATSYGYNGGNPLNPGLGYLRLVQSGADVKLDFNLFGANNTAWQTVALLRNVALSELTTQNMIGANPKGPIVPGLALEGTGNGDESLSGSYFNDTIHGNGGRDYLYGQEGDDLLVAGPAGAAANGSALHGGSGNDTLAGADGDDYLDGGAGDDQLSGGDGNDSFTFESGNDSADGGNGEDGFIVAGAGNVSMQGGAGDDALLVLANGALSGNVRFDGGAGNDDIGIQGADLGNARLTLSGGAGRDSYRIDSLSASANVHVTDFAAGAGGDWLALNGALAQLSADAAARLDPIKAGYLRLVQQGANVLIQLDADGAGAAYAPRTVLTLDNVKLGELGSANFAGSAQYLGWGGNLQGTLGNDLLEGDALNNRLEGGNGDDTLSSGGGDDTLIGGAGDDLYLVDSGSAVTTELANGGMDTVKTAQAAYTLGANLEALQYTGAGDFQGVGNASGNLITGGAGNDTLDGNGGGDILTGLDGDDTYVVRTATDRVAEAADGGYDMVQVAYASAAYTLSAHVEAATLTTAAGAGGLTGNELNNYLSGNASANTLNGGSGNDTLDGGAGADKLAGGQGDDFYLVDNAGDAVAELAAEGQDTVETALTRYALTANVEQLRYTGSANFTGTGNELANRISSGLGNDTLLGGAGNDTLSGGGGKDSIDGGDGDDTLLLSDQFDHYTLARSNGVVTLTNSILGESIILKGIETLVFTDGARTIGELLLNQYSDGDDYLAGTGGDDSIDGLAGADTMSGGAGDDRYVIDNARDTIKELAGEGADTAELTFKAAATYTLDANVENVEIKAAASLAVNVNGNELDNSITGNAAANILSGGAGNDYLDGGAGVDKLIGGSGDDTYRVDNAGDVVTEGLNEGVDTVRTTLSSYTLAANVENLAGPGNGVLNGTGNALDNQIDGGLGNDTLSGLAGNDTLRGGVGDDALQGGDGDDRLEGGIGANILDGGAGADTAVALDDFSAYTVKRPNAIDTVLTHNSSGEALTLRNVEYVIFNGTLRAIRDVQLGIRSAGNDYIRGTDGGDTLDGGAAGADTMAGGAGNDTYQIDDAGDTIVETADGGNDEAQVALAKAGAYTLGLNVENATVTAAAGVAVNLIGNDGDNQLTGNAAANTLTGGAGDDTLDGAAGADQLAGGTGNDVYRIDNTGDAVTELAAQGVDRVETTLAKYTLGANVDDLLYRGAPAFAGSGNELANRIQGGGGNDTLSGLGGDDLLQGGAGNDTLLGGDGADQLDAGTGADVVDGGAGGDTLTLLGNFGEYTRSRPNATDVVLSNATTHESITVRNIENFRFADGDKVLADLVYNTASIGNDSLFGGDGADSLNGLAGADQMYGGKGDDTYTVDQAGDKVFETADSGEDLVLVALAKAETFVMGDNVENAIVTAAAGVAANVTGNVLDNRLTGNAAANTLTGGAGHDTLDGGVGADKLIGGLGDDLYQVDNAGDVVTELAGQGLDRVETSLLKYTLGANVDDLLYTGGAAFAGTGNALANSIGGATGNDTLTGLAGDDILHGGGGNDSLLGGEGADQLDAGTGKDVVDGGAGIDTLTLLGHFADYTRSRPTATELVLVNTLTNESISVRNVEQFIFADDSKSLADVVLNSASIGNDNLSGTDGNDTLDGGAGADSLAGGLGDDTYVIDQAGDLIVEASGQGIDLVNVAYAKAGAYALGDAIENATVTAAAATNVDLSGNALDNILTGNAASNALGGGAGDDALAGAAGNDTLDGGSGNDQLDGGAGADKLVGGSGNDSYQVDNSGDAITELAGGGQDSVTVKLISSYTLAGEVEDMVFSGATAFTGNGNALANSLTGGGGNDALNGLAGNDTLTGNAGNDKLLGGDGNDVLAGGDGNDTLTGGNGADSFVLAAKTGVDVVTDFVSGTDKLALTQSVFGVGDDLVIDNAVLQAAPGGFSNEAELVILTQNVATLNLNTAAAAIGSAASAYAVGDKALFALHSGSTTTLYLFTSNGADAAVGANELTQLVTLTGTATTAAADYQFI